LTNPNCFCTIVKSKQDTSFLSRVVFIKRGGLNDGNVVFPTTTAALNL